MEQRREIKSARVYRFVEEYAKDRNGTQAAIRAGRFYVYLLLDPRTVCGC